MSSPLGKVERVVGSFGEGLVLQQPWCGFGAALWGMWVLHCGECIDYVGNMEFAKFIMVRKTARSKA